MGNNNTKRYLVRLTPIDAYFFGGEVTFGDNLATQNYRVRSNYLPQQSAVLGLMRYEILRQKGCLFENKPKKEDVEKLVGSKGFDPTQPQIQSQTSYGIIQRISPLFIENRSEKRFYTPLPLDYNINVSFDGTINALYNGKEKPLPKIETETIEKKEAFKSKTYDNYLFWCSPGISEANADSPFEKVRVDEIFKETEQVGIQKQGGDDAFFKQTLIRLDDKYNFAFTVEVSEDLDLEKCPAIVPWGGNQSRFKIEIEKIDDGFDFCTYFKQLKRENRLLLLGDAFIPDDTRNGIDFIWGNCIDNRYIVREVKDGRSWGKPPKSKLFQLQSRGSVIYQKDITTLSALKEKIENKACMAIGLNILI